MEDILPSCGASNNSEINGDEADKLGIEVVEEGILGEDFQQENDDFVEDDAEIEEGQLVSKAAKEVDGDLTEEAIGTRDSGFVDSRCEIDTQINDNLVVDENAAVFVETDARIERKDVELSSENGGLMDPEASDGCTRTDVGSKSGAKRVRSTNDAQPPSVHVKYYCLSRKSKQKLEELLRQWSEWHVKNPSENPDQNGGSETGEGTYFPALDTGFERTSAVSFWMENEIRKPENDDFNLVEDESVPLYDRGFALGSADGSSNLEGGLELLDVPRCFNCGSYSHALKECPKPRNNSAVNNSRKQLKSKRNQTAGMRNVARYYQDSPGGKYEGLRPGVLDAETRRLLGLGEFDPPPWLNRMRDIGYPPGYLEPEDENLPSGITIYADEEIKDDKEEGEILEADQVKPQQNMSVLFPGINSPIPKNADERVWASGSSNHVRHRNGDFHSNCSSESSGRGWHREQDYSRDFKDDDSFGSERASKYPPRYGDLDFGSPSHSLRRNASGSRSSSVGRSMLDRGRNDPPDSEDSLVGRLYSSYSYTSSRQFSEHSDASDGKVDQPNNSSKGRDRDKRYRHRSGR